MRLNFWGAAQTVTGSMHEVETGGRRFLLDCGLYQGRRQESYQRNANFPFRPGAIHSVLLSHAHMDHAGNLPTLVRQGFEGEIFANSATIELCGAMLMDSGSIQEKDAEYAAKTQRRRGREEPAPDPLYTMEDAKKTQEFFKEVALTGRHDVADGVSCTRFEAGHMLGSTSMLVEAEGKRLIFSGDVGRKSLPIIRDPQMMEPADYLILESTYGNRFHEPLGPVMDKLVDIVTRTCARGGKIIVPAFAVGRTQQLVLMLHDLTKQGRLPKIPIFVDSPLALNVTTVFRRHPECFDDETNAFLQSGDDPFGFQRLQYIRDANESRKLNDLKGSFMVISASGMAEAGRVLHHLKNNVEDPRNTVLITGFQAEHTLGRRIVEKMPSVPIFGDMYRLRAEVAKLNELSGHADQGELLEWMRPIVPGLKKVFLVHGEPLAMEPLAAVIRETYGVEVVIPKRGDQVELT